MPVFDLKPRWLRRPCATQSEHAQLDIRRKHPGCPDFAATFFAAGMAAKDWSDASIGKALVTMQTVLRHTMTDYDQLLLEGMEARRRVQPKIDAMIVAWKN